MNHHRSSSSNDVAEDVEDGWGSDLEIEDDDDDTDIDNGDQNGDRGNDNNNNNNDGTGTDTDYHAITPITTNRKVVSVGSAELATTTATTGNNVDGVTVTNDGWGMDDDDIDLDDDDDYDDVEANGVEDSHNIHQQAATVAAVHPPNKYQQQKQHLYDDKMIPHRHMYSKLEYELHDYIVSIPQCRITQLKKILLEQYSTPEKALELYQYYMKRPQLLQYTMDKELSRLDYTIVIGSNGVTHSYPKEVMMVQDKEEIRQILSSLQTNNGPTIDDSTLLPLSICGRCANQSILVDILQAMSQPTPPHSDNSNDMILLPSKYMCSAVASHCHFTIDLIQSCVNVKAYFHISLPLLNQRWNIGQIIVTMNFHCPRSTNNNDPQQPLLPPSVDFHVEDYKSLMDVVDILDSNTDEAYAKHLQQCATIIRELSMMDDDDNVNNHHQQPPLQQLPVGSSVEGIMNFRDAYVNELLTTTDVVVDGMKSAWQDFDTATGLVSKFKQLPSLLPSVDPIVYDEEYETAMHHNTDTMMSFSQAQQQPVDSYNGSSYNNDTRPHPTHPPQQPQTSRPTSLLGGFVRSLAQSVTLPQEDPSIYQEWQQQQHHHRQPQQPTLAPPTVAATSKITSNIIPRLYNVETPSPRRHTIYNATPAIDHVKEIIPRLYNISNDKASEQVVYNSEPQYISENSTAISSATAEHESPTKSDMHHLPTISNHLSQNISNIHKVTGPETIPKEQSQDGWDDDIDLTEMDGSCHDTAVDTSICVEMNETMARKGAIELLPSEHDADKVVPWVYDPITDIVPTRTRYRNPIGGYRDLRYM